MISIAATRTAAVLVAHHNTVSPRLVSAAARNGAGPARNAARGNRLASSAGKRFRPVRGGRKRWKAATSRSSSRQQQQQQHPVSQRRRKATLAGNLGAAKPAAEGGRLRRQLQQSNLRERINLWLNEPGRLPVPRWISPRVIPFRYSECFGHGSFFLVAVSYAVDDFLHLRLIAIAGSSAMLVFTYFHPHGRVLWLPFQWNCVFVALNSWRVARVCYDHYRSGQLPDPVDAVYENHFGDAMEKTDFTRLVRLGTLETYQEGDVVVAQGCENRYVRLIVSGDLEVDRDGQLTYCMKEGQFISEMGLHAGLGLRGTVKSCCSVRAAATASPKDGSGNGNNGKNVVRLIRWDRTELMRMLRYNKSIDRSLKAVMSWDIVSKLKSQRVLLASGKIDDPERWTKKRREQNLDRYRAILRNMLQHPKYLNARKDKLAKYREIHRIGDHDHEAALKSVGWTMPEFEAGTKEGQLDQDELEKQTLGYRWWFRSWLKALR